MIERAILEHDHDNAFDFVDVLHMR